MTQNMRQPIFSGLKSSAARKKAVGWLYAKVPKKAARGRMLEVCSSEHRDLVGALAIFLITTC